MPDKLKGEITKIVLDDRSYKETHASFEPSFINYFFGNNGAGKSTIAKAIRDNSGLTFRAGRSYSDYEILVYDQEYITRTIQNYHMLPGVYTINEQNVGIQKQIDEKVEKQQKAKEMLSTATEARDKKKRELGNLQKQLSVDCWDKTDSLRSTFPDALEGVRNSKKKFSDKIQRYSPEDHDLDELKRMYDAVFSDSAKYYSPFNNVSNVNILDEVSGNEILSVSIVNSADTQLAAFFKKIGASEWARQGHEAFYDKTDGRCPYCSRELPPDFEKQFTDSFNNEYDENRKKLDDFLNAYRQAANELFIPLSQMPGEVYPAIDPKPYQDKLAAIKGVIENNISLIREKVEEPSRIVTLNPVSDLLQELQNIISGFNKLIGENNDIVKAGPKKKSECSDKVFQEMAFTLKDVLEAYERSASALNQEIKDQQVVIDAQDGIIKNLESELRDLNSQTVETETVMRNINDMLHDAGFQGFELQPYKEDHTRSDGTIERTIVRPVRNYEVVRTDTGNVAHDLSEGEKNFIAFLCFQQSVLGSATSDGTTKEKIVVIDDPVSSMDSSSLFIVGSLIRKMIEICKNSADNRNPVIRGNFIKQLFVLTHNAYFHREIGYLYADRYDIVSYYLIRKTDNKSSIKLCDKVNPEAPSDRMNVNPVKNSYAALWEEYKELTSPLPLMNVIRRILEYYFLQLCGYKGDYLRNRILVECKDKFIETNGDSVDDSKYLLASAMLSYIAASSSGVNDGFNYVEDYYDTSLCRETFEMIFRQMDQGQHFDMMMGITH